MAGKGRGRPPKKKVEQRAKGINSKNRSVSSHSEYSTSSNSDEETLISSPKQSLKPQPHKKVVLSNWIEEASKSKEVRPKSKMDSSQLQSGDRDAHTKSGILVKISKEDVMDEILFWESSVVCYVLGANPPLHIIEGFVKRIWNELAIDKVGLLGKGVYIVRLTSNSKRDKACDMSRILFDKKPFVIKPWTPKTPTNKTHLTSMPTWVKFPALALEYWSVSTLRKIVSTLGPVIRVDNATSKHERMLYARVLVEMNLYGDFPEEIYFINELDELVSQKVMYDWKPIFCGKCKEMGHVEGKCRMGDPSKKVTTPTPRPPKEGKLGQPVWEVKGPSNVICTSTQKVSQARQEASQPLKNDLVNAQGTPVSTPKKPQTPRHTTEIYSTNAAGEMVITTVEVNTDPGRRKDPPNG